MERPILPPDFAEPLVPAVDAHAASENAVKHAKMPEIIAFVFLIACCPLKNL
jgi:hypothetical protein